MPNFHTKAFPNSQYRFELYANTGKVSGETIAQRKGAVAWCNLGYFDMDTFQPTEGLVIDGKTLSKPRWHDWGVCIGKDGSMMPDLPDSIAGKHSFCAAVPPMVKSGKDAAARKDFAENGTTFIGFRADGTPVVSICPRRLPCKGATSQQAVQELKDKGCVHVLRFDGSWSSQGNLGDGFIGGDKPRIVYSILLIYDRNAQSYPQPNKSTGKTVYIDAGHYTGCSNGNDTLGYKEDEFTLDLSKRLGKLLERCGIKVYQTRKGDEYVSLADRHVMANKVKELDLFVSLHSNANPKAYCDGFGIYTYCAGSKYHSNITANAILRQAKKEGITMWGSGLFHNSEFSVLKNTIASAILVEHGFHTNPKECQLLKSAAYRDKLAEIDARGICEALGVKCVSEIEPEERDNVSNLDTDVSPVHREAVVWCKEHGITDGTRPYDETTREEACTMQYRLYKKIMEDLR